MHVFFWIFEGFLFWLTEIDIRCRFCRSKYTTLNKMKEIKMVNFERFSLYFFMVIVWLSEISTLNFRDNGGFQTSLEVFRIVESKSSVHFVGRIRKPPIIRKSYAFPNCLDFSFGFGRRKWTSDLDSTGQNTWF